MVRKLYQKMKEGSNGTKDSMNAFRKNCPDHKKYLPSRFVPQPLVDESIFFSAKMEVLCILCLCEDLPMVLQ